MTDPLESFRDEPLPPLAGAAQVRARGGQRRRRTQGVGAGVALLAVVAVGTGLSLAARPGSDVVQSADGPAPTRTSAPRTPGAATTPSISPSPPPSPAASSAPTPARLGPLRLLTRDLQDGAALVTIDAAGRTTSRELRGSPGGESVALDATSSTTGDPRACVLWRRIDAQPGDTLLCYAGDSSTGRTVSDLPSEVSAIALSPDGRRLAWTQPNEAGTAQDVLVADFDGSRLSAVRRSEPEPGKTYPGGLPVGVSTIAWDGQDALLISVVADGDDGSGLVRLPLDGLAGGWLTRPLIRPPAADGGGFYTEVRSASSASDGTALALQATAGCCTDGDGNPDRAVRLDLRSGRVLEVVATAAAGRSMVRVVGTSDAVVYTTVLTSVELGDQRTYLRRPGSERLTLEVTGLPEDLS